MPRFRRLLRLGALLVALAAGPAPAASRDVIVGLQPLGSVKREWVDVARRGIESKFRVSVRLLPAAPLPDAAWYEPRKRYRADLLLDFLLQNRGGEGTKTVGLTSRDISATKGEYADWGIFGLGLLGGDVCVVSTHRLGAGKVPRKQFEARLVKVVNHELGHTFGIHHCSTPACLMEDAAGTIGTVDAESGDLCSRCRAQLGDLAR